MSLFLPLFAGIVLAKNTSFTAILVCFVVATISFGVVFFKKSKFSKIALTVALVMLSALYTSLRFDKVFPFEKEQIWKLIYDVKIKKIDFKEKRSKVYGYGKIIKVYGDKYKNLEGHKIYFYINGKQAYIPSQILKIQSGVRILQPHISETFLSYLVQKDIYLYGYRGEVLSIVKEENIMCKIFATVNQKFHERIECYTQKYGERDSDAILYGILLSEKKELSKDQKANFHNTGAAHLLAVSGLHIGMIGLVLDFLGRCFFLKKYWRRVPIIGILLFYVGIIGFTPSAVRAWLMLTCFWSASFLNRKASGISSLLFAATMTLIYDPILLFDIGFQLSYGVVAMLLLFSSPLRDGMLWAIGKTKLRCLKNKIRSNSKIDFFQWKIAELLSISTAATLVSAPLTFEYFNMFSLVGIFLNPIVIQMALPVVTSGILFLILSIFVENFFVDILFLIARYGVALIDHFLACVEEAIPWHIEFLTKPNHIGIAFFLFFILVSLVAYNLHKNMQWKRMHYKRMAS